MIADPRRAIDLLEQFEAAQAQLLQNYADALR